MIWGGKMPLCSDEICWGKIATTNLPLRPYTTYMYTAYVHAFVFEVQFDLGGLKIRALSMIGPLFWGC